MRRKPNQYRGMFPGPEPAYSARQTFVGMAVVAGALLAAVMATAYPVAVVGIVVGAVVARRVARAGRRSLQVRRRKGRTRRLCIPKTGICVEA